MQGVDRRLFLASLGRRHVRRASSQPPTATKTAPPKSCASSARRFTGSSNGWGY